MRDTHGFNANQGVDLSRDLDDHMRTRLNMVMHEIRDFWLNAPYHNHFTNHGFSYSERFFRQKLGPLTQELPHDKQLNGDEIFIVSTAAWLYEIGMQCITLESILDFKFRPGKSLTPKQLQSIREHRHLLAERMIHENVRGIGVNDKLHLGLLRPTDEYTNLIAEVCRCCSDEPFEEITIPETVLINGVEVRARLLVALLRLADQLSIDSSRVNLELLQEAQLDLEKKVRWWVYHYTQVLPIANGQILFYYYLPLEHKPLLGHIRAVVEKDFKDNPIISYLWERGLKLTVHKSPTVMYDQPNGFQQKMTSDIVSYLRSPAIIPLPTPEQNLREEERKVTEQNLLILDYENFLLELGLAGYFLSATQLRNVFNRLMIAASDQFAGSVSGLAVGHWDRPELAPIARLLEASVYELRKIAEHEQPSQVIVQELMQRTLVDTTLSQVLLVAPRLEMAPLIKPLQKDKPVISAWLSDLSDNIYKVLMRHNVKSLLDELELSSQPAEPLSPSQLALDQMACILRLEGNNSADKMYLSYLEVLFTLNEIDTIKQRGDWWYLWLIQQRILLVIQTGERFALKLNNEHLDVAETYARRDAVINAFEPGQKVSQHVLTSELKKMKNFRVSVDIHENDQYIQQFLHILHEEGLVYIDTRSQSSSDHCWYLNASASSVIKRYAPRYLPLFILGIDHFLILSNHPVIHEHTLTYRLRPYVEERFVNAVYQLALERQWVQRQPSLAGNRQNGTVPRVNVRLNNSNEDVQKVLLKRDLLLDILYRKGEPGGIARRNLWSVLCDSKRYHLERNELDEWLTIFECDKLLLVTPDDDNHENDLLRLHPQSTLVHHLLGSMHLQWVVLALRRIGATHFGQQKPVDEAIRCITHAPHPLIRDLPRWSIEYAHFIGMIDISTQKGQSQEIETLYLKQQHNFVYSLKSREDKACQALLHIVRSLDRRRDPDGWVPRPLVIRAMEMDADCFGQLSSEHDYWINQADHRLLLERRIEPYKPGRPMQVFLRTKHRIPATASTRVHVEVEV